MAVQLPVTGIVTADHVAPSHFQTPPSKLAAHASSFDATQMT